MYVAVKRVLFFVGIFLPFIGFSQITIKGQITNKETKEAIPYTAIILYSNGNGTYTDENGNFEFRTKIAQNDTIKISALGYLPSYVNTNSLLQKNVIFLKIELTENVYKLNEIAIVEKNKAKREIHKLGYYDAKHRDSHVYYSVGRQQALYIPNTLTKKGVIDKVKVRFVKDRGKLKGTRVDVRIRIYAVNKQTQGPGEDLLKENIIINPINGGYVVDMSKYNIAFPPDGVFVGIEWVDTKNRTYGKSKETDPGLLWAIDNDKKFLIWHFYNGKWGKQTMRYKTQNNKNNYTPMIGIDVITYKPRNSE